MTIAMIKHARPDPQPESPSLLVELRTSLEVATLTYALAQSAFALEGRVMPSRITDLHHSERRRYENVALIALMLVNRDAQLFAENAGADSAFASMQQFCKDHGLDWLDDTHVINDGDVFECQIHAMAKQAIKRYTDILTGVYPGLSRHLERLRKQRGDGE